MILLDTHVLVWAVVDDRRLGKKARSRIEQARASGNVAVSAFTFWEIGMLASGRRLSLRMSVEDVRAASLRAGIEEIALGGEIAIMATRLSGMHADPADRIIAATAIIAGRTLVTADRVILAQKGGPPRIDAQS